MSSSGDKGVVTIVLTDTLKVSTQVRGTTLIDGVPVAYTESPLNGRAAHASIDANGIEHGLSGATPTNETGTLETCAYLIAALNRGRIIWGRPVAAADHDDADAVSSPVSGIGEQLRIQVVRAHLDSAFWREVSVHRSGSMSRTSEELAEALKAPIELKARQLPQVQRKNLVLAISAIHTPGYVMGEVVEIFQHAHGDWATSIGFKQIWLVGPGVNLTHRLA